MLHVALSDALSNLMSQSIPQAKHIKQRIGNNSIDYMWLNVKYAGQN